MKRFSIDCPDTLKAAAPLMKRSEGVWAVNNVADAWSVAARRGKPDAYSAYIEMGCGATLYRTVNGATRDVPLCMDEMLLTATRHFVKGLKEEAVAK